MLKHAMWTFSRQFPYRDLFKILMHLYGPGDPEYLTHRIQNPTQRITQHNQKLIMGF